MKEKTKKLVILTSYFKGESYWLLGPQMAATIINAHTDYTAIVVGVTHEDDPHTLKIVLNHYFEGQQKLVGFSSLGGRADLFNLAADLKQEGAVTFLAGPQAGADYKGEIDWQSYAHRFKGVSNCFSFALHGPAQQIIPILEAGVDKDLSAFDGILCTAQNGRIIENQPVPWDDTWLSIVDWQTLYVVKQKRFAPLKITLAQVLQQIGCQHAACRKKIAVDYPAALQKKGMQRPFVTLYQKGCSFCDVAKDKGYLGGVSPAAVKEQLRCLPKGADGRKIPFELINESPLSKLSRIFKLADELSIELSQINLTLRADYLIKGLERLAAALEIATKKNTRILLSSIGFESFDDTILKNLNKGLDKQANIAAIRAIRELKSRYPAHLGYLKEEGANHGFIHPTPWDNDEISHEINKTISTYQLSRDILPHHSTPLIIHHGSGLADWIRQIEVSENIEFQRIGTIIGWWQIKDRFLL